MPCYCFLLVCQWYCLFYHQLKLGSWWPSCYLLSTLLWLIIHDHNYCSKTLKYHFIMNHNNSNKRLNCIYSVNSCHISPYISLHILTQWLRGRAFVLGVGVHVQTPAISPVRLLNCICKWNIFSLMHILNWNKNIFHCQ